MRGFPDMLRSYNIWTVFIDDNQENSRPGKGRHILHRTTELVSEGCSLVAFTAQVDPISHKSAVDVTRSLAFSPLL